MLKKIRNTSRNRSNIYFEFSILMKAILKEWKNLLDKNDQMPFRVSTSWNICVTFKIDIGRARQRGIRRVKCFSNWNWKDIYCYTKQWNTSTVYIMTGKLWPAINSFKTMTSIALKQCITKGVRNLLGLWTPNLINKLSTLNLKMVRLWWLKIQIKQKWLNR